MRTNEELISKAEDIEIRRAIEGHGRGGRRKRNADAEMNGTSEDESDHISEGMDIEQAQDHALEPGSSRNSPVIVEDEPSTSSMIPEVRSDVADSIVGSALRKNTDGTIQAPTIVKRRQKSIAVSKIGFFNGY